MRSEHVEDIINAAVHKVVWGGTKPTEYVADYVHKTMLADDWDPLEMLQYEMMALKMRNQYGFDQPIEQD
jgi:hypothetical protein|tara:strand:- start:386 stop:595 length:210 start_codon:yes stop_codon:yes gene_type:complete